MRPRLYVSGHQGPTCILCKVSGPNRIMVPSEGRSAVFVPVSGDMLNQIINGCEKTVKWPQKGVRLDNLGCPGCHKVKVGDHQGISPVIDTL